MKKKGFTLVELLVVIAIIALLMGILMPALARVRQIAYRLYCGTNLSGLGKAMLIYAQDYDDEFPRAGWKTSVWGRTLTNWQGATAVLAYGAPTGAPTASIASCFFLLVKYSEVTPKSFLCKGDSGVIEFKSADEITVAGMELGDVWNFGIQGIEHCSYSYHSPFGIFGVTTSSDPGMAVAADPNPWLDSVETKDRMDPVAHPGSMAWAKFLPTGDKDSIKLGNAQTHQDDGQNVLFVDGHTAFEKASFCGVDDDNIYTQWSVASPTSPDQMRKGNLTTAGIVPMGRNDSLLLTDDGGGTGR